MNKHNIQFLSKIHLGVKFTLLVLISNTSWILADCIKNIEINPDTTLTDDEGKPLKTLHAVDFSKKVWVAPNMNRGSFVGKLLPGARAEILEESLTQYKIKYPKSIYEGWVEKTGVHRTLMVDNKTGEECPK